MRESSVDVAPGLGASERVVVHVDSAAARLIGAAAVLSAGTWLIALVVHDHRRTDWQASRLEWSLTMLAVVALIARGIFLGRPVTIKHAAAAALAVLLGLAAHMLAFDLVGDLLIAGSGLALMAPTTARPRPDDLPRVWALVNATRGDPLAPFAMQVRKCYHFSADGGAALAYRTRIGYAVVSGDPIGDETQFRQLIADFAAMCRARGWRIVVLCCSERRLALWSDPAVIGQPLRAVPVGRDVVIDVGNFAMSGRKFRNLRQAVQRTHNCGVTTEIVAEQDLDDERRAELIEVLRASPSGAHTERGFSMALDGALERRYPGIQLIIARDAAGRVQGFHRYATAGGGSELSLDVPWRRRGAPNGIDERLSVDMVMAAKEAGAQRVSLAFAAFPDIFDEKHRGRVQAVCYRLIHLGDPLIALESLYRYLRKFHSLGERRYVLVRLTQLPALLYVVMSLEFMPRRRRLSRPAMASTRASG
ncbi:phosphatidylglycerol lysyltransferase domain-containing protein [Mycobacterium sp.]|uniref:bifunctional lysylphosphatidylglycerol flippase/synthetase MprF n=1 Tax=Mycobacterium sp. TaxID=1785 RepID=UPI0025CEBE62|nr:phosphatidylglycerol lysyltransferase domain-containing protein [Mycobacterium sp.]